jgi:uroporphyrin-III C-methyltransferase/precorrin-2 dehydrogenase/sirohydrochlorin ferrochelatase
VARHGDVTVAVTAGRDPGRAQRLRAAIAAALAEGRLPVRRRRPGPGRVALVGGGPGDSGLITVRGRRLLAEADVVVVDKLAPRGLVDELDPDVEVVDAGKAPHAHNLTQAQINALIVSRARAGQRVVRLKGGDPFVFGRGAEEALACISARVPVEVVPGVTSAVAVPAYAGIPVTHRGVTQDFAVVSAHLDPSHPGATVDWAALAAGPGTLVLLMAVAHLEQIAAELIKRGRDARTPVAVICDGTAPQQRVLTSTLGQVAADATAQGVAPPAVVVVGEVVRLRALLGGLGDPSGEATGDRLAGQPGEAAGELPGGHPGQAAGDRPVGRPGEAEVGDRLAGRPGEACGELPGGHPGQAAGVRPAGRPGEACGELPGGHPGQAAGQMPGGLPARLAGAA